MIERYQKVMEISRDLASTLDLDVLLRRIVAAAAELCHAEQASILLYDQNKQSQPTSNPGTDRSGRFQYCRLDRHQPAADYPLRCGA
jgi:transcriptional regulator with GAF, ATPase, and Fis domain